MSFRASAFLAAVVAVSFLLPACSRSGPERVEGHPQTVAVRVTPASAELAPNGGAAFEAVVTGTADTRAAWTVVEQGGGTIDAAGNYTAPSAAGTYRVRATSVADPRVSGDAIVTVLASPPPSPPPPPTAPPPPISVSITPSSAALDACDTLALKATVTNAANPAVTWTVQQVDGGSVTAAGVYTAPQSAGTYHVLARSVEDPARTATATLLVSDRILSVAVAPATTSVTAGGSAKFTAVVTTTCGSFTSTAALE
jgi:hypothetical protein